MRRTLMHWRFTEQFAKRKASNVTCVDFIPAFLEQNRGIHGECENINLIEADVTELDLPNHSYDAIFSRSLLMYLSDAEVHSLFTKALSWLRPDGYLFFCETCFKPHDKATVSSDLIQYRRPDFYSSVSQVCADNSTFEVVRSKSVQAFVKLMSTSNEMCWLLQKVTTTSTDGVQTFQEVLDKSIYPQYIIRRFQAIFDKHFISAGGLESTENNGTELHVEFSSDEPFCEKCELSEFV